MDKTGVFAADGSIGDDTYEEGNIEAAKKGVMNWLLTALAVKYAESGDFAKAASVYGNPFADSASIGATPQATANKRCKNYGTCVTDYTGLKSDFSYQATTNVKILNAFLTKSTGNVEIIKEQIKVTYIQAALRYLNKIDNDIGPGQLVRMLLITEQALHRARRQSRRA